MSRLLIWTLKALTIFASAIVGIIVILAAGTWLWVARDLPDPRVGLDMPLTDCPNGTAAQRSDAATLPDYIREAFVVAEQPDFWSASDHPLIATVERSLHGDRPYLGFGGQLAKYQMLAAFGYPHRTANSHLRVIVQADRIAFTLTKTEILNGVLDRMYFGHDAHGLGCAASVYFGKPAQLLDVSEAALLAGLVRGPNNYDPVRDAERARARRAVVVERLMQAGVISLAEAEAAISRPLPVPKSNRQE